MSPREQRAIARETKARLRAKGVTSAELEATSVTVPVYVHVMAAEDGSGNVTNTQIRRQIAVLNNTFGGGESATAADTGFSFELAGTERYFNDVWHKDHSSSTYRKATRRGGADALNMWLVDFKLLGVATFPWDYAKNAAIDGIRTPDGRYLVIRGRLWRAADPSLPQPERTGWVRDYASIDTDVTARTLTALLDEILDLSALERGERRAWYCRRGRKCDGAPHEGYPYNHARGDQWPPPGTDWFMWFLSGGRGSGKTRTGAEYTRKMSEKVGRMALVAPTGADARDTMIEGESGLKYVSALAGDKVHYEPSKRRLTFPNGCIATTFSGEEPSRLRGPQHGFAWLDEPAHMPLIEDVMSNLQFGLRLGERPHIVLTSTPIPTKWVKATQKDPKTRVVRVSTHSNRANLAPNFFETVVAQYEGTRTGLQELEGRLLESVAGALWSTDILHREHIEPEELDRIVVAIDPAGTANRRSDETGIVVAGIRGKIAYVLHDASGKYTPMGWARRFRTPTFAVQPRVPAAFTATMCEPSWSVGIEATNFPASVSTTATSRASAAVGLSASILLSCVLAAVAFFLAAVSTTGRLTVTSSSLCWPQRRNIRAVD